MGASEAKPEMQRIPVERFRMLRAQAEAFPPGRSSALERLARVDAHAYARSRNHLRGAVARLSPYLTHGIISLPEVVEAVGLGAGKFVQELAWREFFALVHLREGRQIFADRFGTQPRRTPNAGPRTLPVALQRGETGIAALDVAIRNLVEGGYLHNRERLWLAAVVCHLAGADWRAGAAWFYYHLLDGDLASNTLSWQWVAGSGSAKPYLADQANLNRFSDHAQHGTFLDHPLAELLTRPVPEVLRASAPLTLPPELPDLPEPDHDPQQPLLLYHPWGLDPDWRAGEAGERWLLLEPALFSRHPMSRGRLAWLLAVAERIPGLRVAVADAPPLLRARLAAVAEGRAAPVHHRDHPAVAHWPGDPDPWPTAFAQRWLDSAAPRSFSAFWKRVAPA
jgi:deoxyribodipyrimidine photo-lyase